MSHPPRAAPRPRCSPGRRPVQHPRTREWNTATGTPIRRPAPRSHPGSAARAHASTTWRRRVRHASRAAESTVASGGPGVVRVIALCSTALASSARVGADSRFMMSFETSIGIETTVASRAPPSPAQASVLPAGGRAARCTVAARSPRRAAPTQRNDPCADERGDDERHHRHEHAAGIAVRPGRPGKYLGGHGSSSRSSSPGRGSRRPCGEQFAVRSRLDRRWIAAEPRAVRLLRAPRVGGSGDDGKLAEATKHQPIAVSPVQPLGPGRETQLREPPQQRGERQLALHAGERGTETEVDAVPEREVPVVGPVEVERFRAPRYRSGSRLADARLMMTCAPAGIVTPPSSIGLERVPERRVRAPARRSGGAPPPPRAIVFGVGAQLGELVGIAGATRRRCSR